MARLLPLLLALPLVACASGGSASTSKDDALTSLPEAAVQSDLDFLASELRAHYASLAAKEAAGFDLAAELATAHAAIHAAGDDAGRIGPLHAFAARLGDIGLVVSDAKFHGEDATDALLALTFRPAEGKLVAESVPGGDVLVAIDGQPVADLVAALAPYASTALPDAKAALVASLVTRRPFWLPGALQPKGPTAHVEVVHPDGSPGALDVGWTRAATLDQTVAAALVPPAPAAAPGSVATPTWSTNALGSVRPEWWTAAVVGAFSPTSVAPSDGALAAIGPNVAKVNAANLAAPRALRFTTGGKAILVVRTPSLALTGDAANAALDWLGALVGEQKPDAVVLDLTNVAGGDPGFVAGLTSLVASGPVPNAGVAYHADRDNLTALLDQAQGAPTDTAKTYFQNVVADLQRAYDASAPLGASFPPPGLVLGTGLPVLDGAAYGAATVAPNPRGTYPGPLLVLQDERTAGAPEALALTLRGAGIAKTFGTTSAGNGGLPASVVLPASQTRVSFARALLSAGSTPFQDRGVVPDIARPQTVHDAVDGHVGFVTSFLQTAAGLVR